MFFGVVFLFFWITVVRKVPFEEVIFRLRHQLSEGMSHSDTERGAFQAAEPQVHRS